MDSSYFLLFLLHFVVVVVAVVVVAIVVVQSESKSEREKIKKKKKVKMKPYRRRISLPVAVQRLFSIFSLPYNNRGAWASWAMGIFCIFDCLWLRQPITFFADDLPFRVNACEALGE